MTAIELEPSRTVLGVVRRSAWLPGRCSGFGFRPARREYPLLAATYGVYALSARDRARSAEHGNYCVPDAAAAVLLARHGITRTAVRLNWPTPALT
jgi:hypothetical protein